jgi:hypothetical protein
VEATALPDHPPGWPACSRCGHRPASDGLRTCRQCRDDIADIYATRRRLGLCTKCGKEDAEANRAVCSSCAARDARRKKRYAERARKRGKCTRCKQRKARDGRAHCVPCAEDMAMYFQMRRMAA